MRMALISLMALGAAACATGGPTGGYANYDALKRAQADCAARGGTLKLKPQGNSERIDAWACERK